MPVEIRELVIQTQVVSSPDAGKGGLSNEKMAVLKKQIVQECLRVLKERTAKNSVDR